MSDDIDMGTVQAVQAQLRDVSRPAPVIAKRAGVSVETAYHALVWMYDRGMVRLATEHWGGRRRVGWELA